MRGASRSGWVRRVAVIGAVVVGTLLVGRVAGGYLPGFAAWVDAQGAWGAVVFVAAYVAATVAFVPGSLLTLAAGAIFGLVRGVIYVFLGAVIGSAAAFLIARYVARPAVERRIAGDPRFEQIDRAVAQDGRKIVFLLRLSPVLPYNLLNYALGLTRVRFRDYLIAAFGMLPGTVLFVYSGQVAGSLAALAGGAEVERGTGYYLVLVVGLVATAAVTVWVTRIARRALKHEHQEAPAQPDARGG